MIEAENVADREPDANAIARKIFVWTVLGAIAFAAAAYVIIA